MAALILYFSIRYYDFAPLHYALLLLVIGLVITCELFNTAIEKTVDMESPGYNGLAKIAKDVAAGAVLVSSITAVGVSVLLFWDTAVLSTILTDIGRQFLIWLAVVAALVLWIIWPERAAILRSFSQKKK